MPEMPALVLAHSIMPTYSRTMSPRPLLPLEVQDLVYEVDGARLIDHISLQLDAHGRTVIMGPNGAGKSLLLRLLHGLLEPSGGEISWNGNSPDRAVRKRQAMVFQRPVLLRRSVAANIAFVLRSRGIAESKLASRTDELLALARLSSLASSPARRLSGGEQQRLAVVRALATEPDVLLLDEPTSSLDPASTQAIEHLIQHAHGGGCKIILTTHDLGQARRVADEVVFLNHGRLEVQEPEAQFFYDSSSATARAYLAGDLLV